MNLSYDKWILIVVGFTVIAICLYFAIFVYPHREWTEETKRRPRSFISNAFFREFWYFMMEPFKKKLIEWDVNPNTITFWGFIFSIAAGVAFAFGQWGLAGLFVILSSTCDVYDGALARAKNISLKSGAFFDSTLDRVGETAIFYGLLWYFRHDWYWFLLIFLGSSAAQLVSYTRARAEGLGFSGARGAFQRAERMIVLSIGNYSVPLIELVFGGSAAWMAKLSVIILCLGSLQTACTRSWSIYWDIRSTEGDGRGAKKQAL